MILHVAVDAFYASIEELFQPELMPHPLIVCKHASQSVVESANFEAQRDGIHCGMLANAARKHCPRVECVPPQMSLYMEVSQDIHSILHCFTPMVETLAPGEAFLDTTDSEHVFGSALKIGREIQEDIFRKIGLSVSVGVAPVKFIAKIASDMRKPDRLCRVKAEGMQATLDSLAVGRLWGIGKVSGQPFTKLGIRTIGELRRLRNSVFSDHFGPAGNLLWQLARGIDKRPVMPDHETNSISNEISFAREVDDQVVLRSWLSDLVEQAAARLCFHNVLGSRVQVRVFFADFRTVTLEQTMTEPTNNATEICAAAGRILETGLPAGHLPVRRMHISVDGFDASEMNPSPAAQFRRDKKPLPPRRGLRPTRRTFL